MPRKKPPPKINAVLDFETDPFMYGRVPRPFVTGFYDGTEYRQFWGDDCVQQFIDWLTYDAKADYRIYAHNGGKFDFFLMLEHLENPIKIINGRIVKCKLGRHELRDSYAIMPIPLAAYEKDEIDYAKFEPEVRDSHADEIGHYLRGDCEYLYRLVAAFWERFGDKLTIGSTAIGKLREIHPFDSQGEGHDNVFRPFYFGGRVECFESGILSGDFKVYDVNSMYPYVMAHYPHPTGSTYKSAYSGIVDRKGKISGFADYPMFFAVIECQQSGAFATRRKDGPLDFNVSEGEFYVTSHELQAAIKAGRVQNIKVNRVWAPEKVIYFKEYVETYMAEKVAAKKRKDKVSEIFAKLLLNSAYGKFGSNPDNYFDWFIQGPGEETPEEPYEIYSVHDGDINVWRKPTAAKRFFDVATAASVTGAARSVLLHAITQAKRPVYCDTDSLICTEFLGTLDETRLGAWKLEGSGNTIAIAGKKLYALRDGETTVKLATKGVRLTSDQIFAIAGGASVEWRNDAPTFSLNQSPRFIHRKIQSR